MGDIGHNPACIIPAWRDFVAGRTGADARRRRADLARPHARRARRVPVPRGAAQQSRSPTPPASICCAPTTPRTSAARSSRRRSAPTPGSEPTASARYRGDAERPPQFAEPLPPAPGDPAEHRILWDTLGTIRALVGRARARGRRLRAARRRPRPRHPRGRHQQHPPRRRRGRPARLARPRHRGLRGQRRRPPRQTARRPRAPRARRRRRLGPVAGEPAVRPRPATHVAQRQRGAAASAELARAGRRDPGRAPTRAGA